MKLRSRTSIVAITVLVAMLVVLPLMSACSEEEVDAPVAAFSATPLTGAAPLEVTFTDLSTNEPTEWDWDFGDGNTSTDQDPTNTYTAAGTYTVELTATNDGGEDTKTQTGYITVTAAATAIFDVIQDAAIAYIADADWTMTADELQTLLTNASDLDDPVVVSVRASTVYDIGHIEGAINIGLTSLVDTDSLAQLPDDDTKVVTYCYTGHTGSQAAAILNMIGYNATTLKFGMCGWSDDADVQGTTCGSTDMDYDVVTTATAAGDTYDLPDLGTSTDTDEEILLAAAAAYLASSPDWSMSAEELHDVLTNASDLDDPIVVDVRSADSYALGHIEGAINIPLATLADTASLEQLDPERDIVTYCVTGHTGSQAAAILNMLGYNATTLKHAMCAWDAEQSGTSCYSAPAGYDTVATS